MPSNILVVDDDEPIRQLVSHRLQSDGYGVRICKDGQEAADLLEEGFEPILIVLDVMMPGLDGKRLLRMVRNDEFEVDEDLPIIMLTSRGREEHILEGLESGANDYVTKPFKAAELLARVRKCLDD